MQPETSRDESPANAESKDAAGGAGLEANVPPPPDPLAAPLADTAEAAEAADVVTTAAAPAEGHAGHEGSLAFRNALKLGTSMMLTWGVALIVTFKLPKYLGPQFYGFYKYGDQFAASLAVFLTLGVDTYISREIAVRPKHASDFFLGMIVSRTAVMVPLLAYGWFSLSHKLPEEQVAGALFGIAYLFTAYNQTFQQTLQAASQVGGLAVANVVAKVLWGGGTFLAVSLRAPFWVLPLPMVAAEFLKACFLYRATKHAVDLRLRLDLAATRQVLTISFPFFIANVAVTLGSTIDVVILRAMVPAGSDEVGWYGAAREIARLSALLSPIMSGVLIPMMSRAKARSDEDFFRILRRGFEAVNVISIPLTLMLALGADFWIHITIKDKFLPATGSLVWLAPTFVFAYANVLLWLALMILDRSWTITLVSIAGLILLPVLIWLAVPIASTWGPGGAGTGVAMALSTRELIIVLTFLAFLRSGALDRRGASSTLKSLAICAVVGVVHWKLASIGPWRLMVDGLLYAALAVATGVLRPSDAKAVLKMVKDRKKPQPA